MILVSGATGTVGRHVTGILAAKGVAVRALTRDPQKAAARLAAGVEIVKGDFARPESLDRALAGVDRTLLLSNLTEDFVDLQKEYVDAARRAGVRHIVKLSGLGASPSSTISMARWHGQVEQHIEESGMSWTHVRPALFMQSILMSRESIRTQGSIYIPAADARIAMIDARDIAAVVAAVLTQDGHESKAYDVTGPSAIGYDEVAAVLTSVLGKRVSYIDVMPEIARYGMSGMGMAEWLIDAMLELFELFRSGGASAVSGAVEQVTGRAPGNFQKFALDHLAAFQV